jgi:ribosomal protein S18 acetylase RimI-like enzyme
VLAIRPAVRDDAWAVARVHGAARAAYYGVPEPGEVDPERVGVWWLAISDPRRTTVLVAEQDDAVLGFASFGPPLHEVPSEGPVLELHSLYVLPGHWDGGIGAALYEHFLARLRAQPGRTAVLSVWDGNPRAIAFWERRGWHRDGRSRPGPDGSSYIGMSLAGAPAQR